VPGITFRPAQRAESKDTNLLLEEAASPAVWPARPVCERRLVILWHCRTGRRGVSPGTFSLGWPGGLHWHYRLTYESPETGTELQAYGEAARNLRIATTLGYGPRSLHSTGQYHKGGPDNGLFVQFVADDQLEAPIPGRNYGFGTFKQAQALGDFQALQKHGRRVMKVNLGQNIIKGLKQFRGMVDQAIAGA